MGSLVVHQYYQAYVNSYSQKIKYWFSRPVTYLFYNGVRYSIFRSFRLSGRFSRSVTPYKLIFEGVVLSFFGRFHGLYNPIFRVSERFSRSATLRHSYRSILEGREISLFCDLLNLNFSPCHRSQSIADGEWLSRQQSR